MQRLYPYSPTGRIVGGHDVAIEDVPYQVSLQVYGFGFCGGSIVSTDWILTAGHCVESYQPESITVRAGTNRMSKGGSIHSVEKIIKHENYRICPQGIPCNDIAVMKLNEPFKLDATRQPISMFKQFEESTEGSNTILTGWGSSEEGGGQSEVLKTVQVQIVSKKNCYEAYKHLRGIPEGQICAAVPEGGKDTCQGDSGGPVAVKGRLAGIVAWGLGCARKGYPGVYTEVAWYRDWIKKQTEI